MSAAPRTGQTTTPVSVVVCAYTLDRWDDLAQAVTSLEGQTFPPTEIVVVSDHNSHLIARVRETWPHVVALENAEAQGLSGARNTGVAAACGRIIAFLDDDAVAEPEWLERLVAAYDDPAVFGVGGAILPAWADGRPAWFPAEFDWVVGCTYKGMSPTRARVRNLIGANMSFRRELLDAAGNFQTGMGRIGTRPLGCEETELCIRGSQKLVGAAYLYEPAAVVHHTVPAARQTWRYFASRCYSEGLSKAHVSELVGTEAGLSSERSYTFRTLPLGVLRGLGDAIRGDLNGLRRAAAIVAGLGITTLGYVRGSAVRRAARRREQAARRLDRAGRDSVNILQVTPGYQPVIGGVERHVQALAERLVARGHRVTVATLEPRGRRLGNERHGEVDVLRFPAWGVGDAYRLPRGMAGYLATHRNRFDIVHVHNYHAPLIPLVGLSGAWPYVVTTHLNDTPHSGVARLLHAPYKILGAAAVRRASAIICVTEAERIRVEERLGVLPERTVVIPNGFDPQLLAARRTDSRERDPFLLLSVGRLQGYKRVDTALRALALLERPYRLAIVGDGPERGSLEALAAELGVAGRVTFAGRASDGELVDWYGRAGVVVSLSSAEAFGMTVLEAVAAGTQVVSSSIPAFVDLARLFPGQVTATATGDPQQVAVAVREAGRRALQPPADVSAFTWDAVTKRVLDVYWGVLEPARRPRQQQSEGAAAGSTEMRRKHEDGRKVSSGRTGTEQGGT